MSGEVRDRGPGAPGDPAKRRPADDDGDPSEAGLPDPDAPHVVPIENRIDLHSFLPRDVPDVVRDYLEAAVAAGFREVRLIHGRGIGAQRERVRALLAGHVAVESFADAPADRGHWGATVVTLRGAGAPRS